MKGKKVSSLALAAMLTMTAGFSQISMASESQGEELEPATIQLWLGGPGKQKDSDEVWEAFNEKLQEYVPNTTVELT